MHSSISAKRISGSTTFKIIFVGFLAFHIVSTLLVLLLVLLGVLPLEASSAESTDMATTLLFLAGYLLIGVVFSPIWVGILWLSIWPGVWLYSLLRPMEIRYVPPDGPTGSA